MNFFPFALSALAAISACGEPIRNEHLSELRSLRVDRASDDAEAALERDDRRLLGVLGVACEVPGTTYMCSQAAEEHGLRILEGTSDEPMEGEEEEPDARARRYALAYNRTIISRATSTD